MLTATYSIVTLKLEQKKARWNFSALQRYIFNNIKILKSNSRIDFESMLNRLSQFEQYCHQRKMEIFMIPALRKFTHEADSLLEELESLRSMSLSMLSSLREKLQDALRQGALKIEEVCNSLEQCCSNLYKKLIKEEELVQIAERVIPQEEWFDIAASFLSHDAKSAKSSPETLQEEE
jgi:hypothetical protein